MKGKMTPAVRVAKPSVRLPQFTESDFPPKSVDCQLPHFAEKSGKPAGSLRVRGIHGQAQRLATNGLALVIFEFRIREKLRQKISTVAHFLENPTEGLPIS